MRRAAYVIALCFFLTSCAQTAEPLSMHVQSTALKPEHDEIVSQDAVAEFYPNRQTPHEVIYRKLSGGLMDINCTDENCRQFSIVITGSKAIPDGAYQFIRTDDPHVMTVRDSEGMQTLGYFVQNDGGGEFKFFPDLAQAQTYEHEGDTARTAGKVAGGVLLGAALVAALVAAAAAANANGSQ